MVIGRDPTHPLSRSFSTRSRLNRAVGVCRRAVADYLRPGVSHSLGGAHLREEFVLAIIFLPPSGIMELGEMRATPLDEGVPFPRDIVGNPLLRLVVHEPQPAVTVNLERHRVERQYPQDTRLADSSGELHESIRMCRQRNSRSRVKSAFHIRVASHAVRRAIPRTRHGIYRCAERRIYRPVSAIAIYRAGTINATTFLSSAI